MLQVHVWKDALQQKQKAAYLHHRLDGRAIANLRFCPYEDVLAIGHAQGLSSMLVPGAGEPNFDSMVANPYQTSRARQEQEVHQLLDKLPPDMITLDPASVAKVRMIRYDWCQVLWSG
jgi:U3 small nucleolar RNA-associated protein 7